MTSIFNDTNAADRLVREQAFRLLLKSGEPLSMDQLASSMQSDIASLSRRLERLAAAGRIRRGDDGRVIGAAGLSVVPDRHEMTIGERTLWTWCAYDILGIMGALKASGSALSRSASTARELRLNFIDGVPDRSGIVLFRPDDSFADCCTNTYDEWCPNSNFFENAAAAQAWSEQHRVSGEVFTLDQAAAKATPEWTSLLTAE